MAFQYGTGTQADPYQIWTPAELDEVRLNLSSYFIQMADIDLSAWGNWAPIDNFSGSFDGNNFTIINLEITETERLGAYGLFGEVATASSFRNINIVSATLNFTLNPGSSSRDGYGILIGSAVLTENCVIENCHVSGSITSSQEINSIGGIAGFLMCDATGVTVEVLNCTSNVTIEHSGIGDVAGGLIGLFDIWHGTLLTAKNNKSNAVIKGIDTDIGGLFGMVSYESTLLVENNESRLVVEGATMRVGGLTGEIVSSSGDAQFYNNFSSIYTDSSPRLEFGGHIAQVDLSLTTKLNIDSSFSTGQIFTSNYLLNDTNRFPSNIGGFIGVVYGGFEDTEIDFSISNCYTRTKINMILADVDYGSMLPYGLSGFIGSYSSDSVVSIQNSYSATDFYVDSLTTYADTYMRGFIHTEDAGTVSANGCYYDYDLTTIVDNHATPKTTAEMKTQSTFTNWNFGSTWDIKNEMHPDQMLREDWLGYPKSIVIDGIIYTIGEAYDEVAGTYKIGLIKYTRYTEPDTPIIIEIPGFNRANYPTSMIEHEGNILFFCDVLEYDPYRSYHSAVLINLDGEVIWDFTFDAVALGIVPTYVDNEHYFTSTEGVIIGDVLHSLAVLKDNNSWAMTADMYYITYNTVTEAVTVDLLSLDPDRYIQWIDYVHLIGDDLHVFFNNHNDASSGYDPNEYVPLKHFSVNTLDGTYTQPVNAGRSETGHFNSTISYNPDDGLFYIYLLGIEVATDTDIREIGSFDPVSKTYTFGDTVDPEIASGYIRKHTSVLNNGKFYVGFKGEWTETNENEGAMEVEFDLNTSVASLRFITEDYYCYESQPIVVDGEVIHVVESYVNENDGNIFLAPSSSEGYPYLQEPYVYEFGDGTELNPYQIWTPEDLNAVRGYLSAYFIQMVDIDMSSWGDWIAIGGWDEVANPPFKGSYEGQNYKISNLSINKPNDNYIGLFGKVDGAVFSNIKVENLYINANESVAFFVGVHNSNISNVNISGVYEVTSGHSGGVAHQIESSTITNCSFIGDITSKDTSTTTWVGGFASEIYGESNITKCFTNVNISGNYDLSGFVADVWYSTIEECYAIGYIFEEGGYSGGFAGSCQSSTIINCYTNVDLESTLNNADVSTAPSVSGFAGYMNNSTIEKCYSAGKVTLSQPETVFAGERGCSAFVSDVSTLSESFIIDCYYDNDVDVLNKNELAEPKTTKEMKTESTYTNWDFYSTWTMHDYYNRGYPYLQWQEMELIPISNIDDLNAIRSSNEHTFAQGSSYEITTAGGLDKNYIQVANINLQTVADWIPIGDDTNPFIGTFSGGGYYIWNLIAKKSTDNNVGLFGVLSNARIVDLELKSVEIETMGSNAGIVAGKGMGTLEIINSKVHGSVKAKYNAGGFIGVCDSVIAEHLTSEANIVGLSEPSGDMGGIFGKTSGDVNMINSKSTGRVGSTTHNKFVGGLIGRSIIGLAKITGSHSTGDITGDTVGGLIGEVGKFEVVECYGMGNIYGDSGECTGGNIGRHTNVDNNNLSFINLSYHRGNISGDNNCGGVVGFTNGCDVYQCYFEGFITGIDNIGGIVGYGDGLYGNSISQSFAKGEIRGNWGVGGIAGWVEAYGIENCYNHATIFGITRIGGAVGFADTTTSSTNIYSAGSVDGQNEFGGLFGYYPTKNITSSYWDSETSGQTTSDGGTSKTSVEMKQEATFVGWNFADIWHIDEGEDYPKLQFYAEPHGLTPFMVEVDGATTMGGNSRLVMDSMGNLNTSFRGVYIPSQIETATPWDGIINRGGWRALGARWKFNHGTYLLQNDTTFAIYNNSSGTSRGLFIVSSDGDVIVKGDLQVNGNKNCVVDTDNYGQRLMYAVETPDSRFVSYVEMKLEEGEHWIEIEPMFYESISEFFIVPHVQNGSDVVILERRDKKFRVWVYGYTAEVVFEINGKRKYYEGEYMREYKEPKLER